MSDELLEAFDRGWQAHAAYVTEGTNLSVAAAQIDLNIIRSREARRDRDARLQRLDAAQRMGERAYAEERAAQGLIMYDRHREMFNA